MTLLCQAWLTPLAFAESWGHYSSKRCVSSASRSANWSEPMLQPFNASTMPFRIEPLRVLTPKKAREDGGECAEQPVAPEASKRPTCADPQSLRDSGIRMLVGVMSSPKARERRDGIRQTWMRWPSVGHSVVVCFVLGRLGPSPTLLQSLDDEAREHKDVLWLPSAPDGCSGQHMHIAKAYEFWVAAAAALPRGRGRVHVVKTDDDAQLHLPWLQRELGLLRCVSGLFYGPMVWVGFNPATFKQCGWDWTSPSRYHAYKCPGRGFHEAAPYALGALEVLSDDLARALAASAAVTNFVAASTARPVVIEDPVLGYWLSSPQMRSVISVTYVRAYVGNLNCHRPNAGGGRVLNHSVGMHHLKLPAAQRYAWDLLRGKPYDQPECSGRTNPHDPNWKAYGHLH